MTQYLFFGLAFAASAAAPGPEVAALVGRALSRGLPGALPLAAGIVVGKLLMLSAAVVGLTVVVRLLGPVFVVLQVAGAAYLVYLGVRRWRRAGRPLPAEASGARGVATEVSLGLLLTLSNPVAIIFYAALLPGVIDVDRVTVPGYLGLCAVLVAVMVLVVLGYGLLAELARRLFTSGTARTRIDRASGLVLVVAGVLVALR